LQAGMFSGHIEPLSRNKFKTASKYPQQRKRIKVSTHSLCSS